MPIYKIVDTRCIFIFCHYRSSKQHSFRLIWSIFSVWFHSLNNGDLHFVFTRVHFLIFTTILHDWRLDVLFNKSISFRFQKMMKTFKILDGSKCQEDIGQRPRFPSRLYCRYINTLLTFLSGKHDRGSNSKDWCMMHAIKKDLQVDYKVLKKIMYESRGKGGKYRWNTYRVSIPSYFMIIMTTYFDLKRMTKDPLIISHCLLYRIYKIVDISKCPRLPK